jgi:hypothetical protein
VHAISIFKYYVMFVWMYTLNKSKSSTYDNNTSIIVFQGRSDNGQSIHSGTSTDTSTSTRTKSPNGQGIDQHSTWFHIGRDRLSSTEGDGSGC